MGGTLVLNKLLYSLAICILGYLFFYLLKRYTKKTQEKFGFKQTRYLAAKRLISICTTGFVLIGLLVIWNVDIKNAWTAITGILALVAVAFFAVWSLIGNILAGVLLYFTSPFKVEDYIEIMPDEIRGQVLMIYTFYTVLIDDCGNYIMIPNSMFFQKYVKKYKQRPNLSDFQRNDIATHDKLRKSDDATTAAFNAPHVGCL